MILLSVPFRFKRYDRIVLRPCIDWSIVKSNNFIVRTDRLLTRSPLVWHHRSILLSFPQRSTFIMDLSHPRIVVFVISLLLLCRSKPPPIIWIIAYQPQANPTTCPANILTARHPPTTPIHRREKIPHHAHTLPLHKPRINRSWSVPRHALSANSQTKPRAD